VKGSLIRSTATANVFNHVTIYNITGFSSSSIYITDGSLSITNSSINVVNGTNIGGFIFVKKFFFELC
jgi:hypothetical protein